MGPLPITSIPAREKILPQLRRFPFPLSFTPIALDYPKNGFGAPTTSNPRLSFPLKPSQILSIPFPFRAREMDNYSYSSYPDSGNSSPRSREIECETPSWDEPSTPASVHYKVKFMCSYGGKIQPGPTTTSSPMLVARPRS
ncbi:hypothetical protein I3842_Q136600 [Carya illinoinensis]|uniref:Uncharacterized protein n=1 Tax=Carya illinoinensis TaxID=32201 RepID=A0A922A1A6_CARIL|nr:hypothetical protein I3842_Q136600 [Carya illinoinensis]